MYDITWYFTKLFSIWLDKKRDALYLLKYSMKVRRFGGSFVKLCMLGRQDFLGILLLFRNSLGFFP